ncbi:MAG: hypothetical protein ABJG78_16825 [Cyclobacteriaceae bacterium]
MITAFSLEYNQATKSEQAFFLTKSHLDQMVNWERELLAELNLRIKK